jgi:hypothetical protein
VVAMCELLRLEVLQAGSLLGSPSNYAVLMAENP